ncbi:MAG: bifunctional chorismate mutase/prephenate dehydratase [Ruminococcaceae bacterium]|nr:bifunctional chorismate mutase/prephenate dehydratase [Oscillospiraceae bacterium]
MSIEKKVFNTAEDTLLDEARQEINAVDAEMAALFVRRMRAAEKVAEYKRRHALPILDPSREEAVIAKNAKLVEDEELRSYYVNFIRENMALSRAYQQRLMGGMRVAYCGTEGAFAHIAAGKMFPGTERVAFNDFKSAYRAVEKGECDAAVLPVENSYNGEVGQVTDLMFSGSLYVSEMTELAVSHDLLVVPGTKKEDIREVISHPQALGQCAEYIRSHAWLTGEYSNTALAARYVADKGDRSLAAIASEEAAEIFGLEVLERNINASRSNTTRFAAFSRVESKRHSGRMGEHFILLFTVKNEAGALAKAMDVIGRFGFNMRTLRSRPMKELLWQYYFYVEAEGDVYTEAGEWMMRELGFFCDRLKLVGTYFAGGN